MNKLVRELIRPFLEQEGVTALYGGGFKPPTKGHFNVVKKTLESYPEIDKLIIYVGSGVRDGIGQEQSLEIWGIYKDLLDDRVEIIPSKAPIGDIYRYAKNNPDEKVYFTMGAREGRDEDMTDIATRTRDIETKYPNTSVKVITTADSGMSGTNARKSIDDATEFIKYLPSELPQSEKETVYNIVNRSMLENVADNHDGKAAPFGSGYKKLNEHSMGNSIDLESQIDRLTQHMLNKGYNIEPLPSLEFVDDDITNAEDFLGKTAYYNPDTQAIVLYTHGRHPKDIARSYAHEMIHHIQNLEGRLGDITTTNTQEDDKLNDLEAEANLKGTMTFRNWTDSLNEDGQETSDTNMDDYKKQNNPSGKVKDPFGLNAYAYELAQGLEEAIVGDKIECDNCDWSWNIKDGGDDLYICHECGHDNTPQLNEGIYDSLVTRLTNITIKKWISDFEANPKIKQSFVDIDIDEEDSKGREIEFNYVGQLKFDKKIGGYEVDGTSNSGEEDDKYAFIATLFKVNPEVLPNAWSKISADVSDVIRHEIEHLTQAGDNVRSSKYKDDDIQIRDMINKLKILPYKNYYLLDKEVDAMLQGLYLKAKKTKKPFADVINNYLDIAPGIETKEDKEVILNLWRSRRKALSLPVFENEKQVMDYKIHLDMDGVITDFDKQFKELTGMMPNEFETKYGVTGFWEAIDKAGVGFWRGMEWMPDGQELYNKVSQFDHELLSSPSRGESSKIGKRLWRRDKTPNTKLTLAYSANKKNYAAPNHILIDDRVSNIDQWKAAGGIGILHTSAASTIAKLKKLGL